MSRRSRLFVSTSVKDWGRSPLSRVPATAAPYDPSTLNPDLWLDAADTSTITEAGGAVSQWDNKGSLGNFVQATGAVQPTTGASKLNGLNVIDFAGDYLTADDTNEWKFLHDGTDWIIGAVVKFGTSSNPNAAYFLFGNNGGSLSAIGVNVIFDDRISVPFNNALRVAVSRGVAGQATALATHDDVLPASAAQVLTAVVDPDNATAADRVSAQLNAGSLLTAGVETNAPSASNPTHPLQIGAAGNNSAPLTGYLAELIIVSGANATATNREALRDYLNSKWRIY